MILRDYRYFALLDWGRMPLVYDGPLEDLALSEAKRRCIKGENLRRVIKETREVIYTKESPDGE